MTMMAFSNLKKQNRIIISEAEAKKQFGEFIVDFSGLQFYGICNMDGCKMQDQFACFSVGYGKFDLDEWI